MRAGIFPSAVALALAGCSAPKGPGFPGFRLGTYWEMVDYGDRRVDGAWEVFTGMVDLGSGSSQAVYEKAEGEDADFPCGSCGSRNCRFRQVVEISWHTFRRGGWGSVLPGCLSNSTCTAYLVAWFHERKNPSSECPMVKTDRGWTLLFRELPTDLEGLDIEAAGKLYIGKEPRDHPREGWKAFLDARPQVVRRGGSGATSPSSTPSAPR
jgi:hypothetical protein